MRDTVIQVRHNNSELVAVRTERRALIFGVVDLCLMVAALDVTSSAEPSHIHALYFANSILPPP